MGREKLVTGKIGEGLALEFLKRNGYRVLKRNFRTPLGELDAIAKKGNIIAFIEIKARTSSSLGPPYLAVTRQKQVHIIKSALFYLKRRGLMDADWRIDVVSVNLNYEHRFEKIELLENAVEYGGWL